MLRTTHGQAATKAEISNLTKELFGKKANEETAYAILVMFFDRRGSEEPARFVLHLSSS